MNSVGVIALIVVLAAATGFGLWRRRVDGKFSQAKQQSPTEQGKPSADSRLTAEELGQPLGEAATLVQFSSAFCAPCRATKRTLDRVAGMVNGVTYAEVDAESQLELTRRFNILRTPTVFILDANGTIAHRASGQPRLADVVAALGPVVPGDVAAAMRDSDQAAS